MKTHVGQTKDKLNYLFAVLKDKKSVVSRVAFWKIPHDHQGEDIHLRIGRYITKKTTLPGEEEIPEVDKPKISLTLDKEEFQNLIAFLQENYEPFKKGIKQYIPITEEFSQGNTKHLKALFANPEKSKLQFSKCILVRINADTK